MHLCERGANCRRDGRQSPLIASHRRRRRRDEVNASIRYLGDSERIMFIVGYFVVDTNQKQ